MTISGLSVYRQTYPDPFLDIASTRLPKTRKKLLELFWVFATQHPQIAPIIKKLARYPITNIVANTDSGLSSIRDKWIDLLEEDLNIYESIEEFGLNFFGMGVVFARIHKPFLRYYKCETCGKDHSAIKFDYFITNKKVVGKCQECKVQRSFAGRDEKLENASELDIVFLNPMDMTIKRVPLTKTTFYYYKIPPELSSAIKATKPDREVINNTPWEYVQAAIENKSIKFTGNSIFYAKEPTITGPNSEWGIPITLPALKDAYLNQIYKKADESMANERSVPARFVYPQASASDPLRMISLAKWNKFMETSLRKWRNDKNAVMPVPFPVGVATLGGEANQYNTLPLREATIREIIGATGVPQGFLSDPMTWSGGSIQLRMLENSIMAYLRAIDRFLMYVVKEIRKLNKWEKCKVTLKPFSKSDDVQMTQLLISLAEAKIVSWKEVLERIDLDLDEEHDKIVKEQKKFARVRIEESITEARAVLESAAAQAEAHNRQEGYASLTEDVATTNANTIGVLKDPVRSLEEHEKETEQAKEEQQPETSPEEEEAGIKENNAIFAWVQKLKTLSQPEQKAYLDQLRSSAPQAAAKIEQLLGAAGSQSDNLRASARSPEDLANKIIMLAPKERAQAFQELQQNDPTLAIKVMSAMNKKQTGGQQKRKTSVDMRPMPDRLPPRRK